jgi:hypothetical protein
MQVLRDTEENVALCEFLGLAFDGPRRRLRHLSRRCWRLCWGLEELIRRGGARGEVVRLANGHLCHHFGLTPCCLPVLDSLFRFALRNEGRWARFGVLEINELIIARGLVFNCGVNLAREVSHAAYCSDSSKKGCCLMEMKAAPQEVLDAMRWKVCWWFVEVRDPAGHVEHSLAGISPSGSLGIGVGFGFSSCFDGGAGDAARAEEFPGPRTVCRSYHTSRILQEHHGVAPA